MVAAMRRRGSNPRFSASSAMNIRCGQQDVSGRKRTVRAFAHFFDNRCHWRGLSEWLIDAVLKTDGRSDAAREFESPTLCQ